MHAADVRTILTAGLYSPAGLVATYSNISAGEMQL